MVARKRNRAAQPKQPPATTASVEAGEGGADGSARAPSVVGIGASAGGVEALQRFFHNTPPNSGLAFVVIHHRDPSHRGLLVEIVQRVTSMQVLEVAEGMRPEPDHVYINPSNREVMMHQGLLHLVAPVERHSFGLPIDRFFRSLADDQEEASIGVILSGMGTDGTLGLRAIKEKAGCTFVQSPHSAKFDGMPRSAIDALLADVVADDDELPTRIVAYAARTRTAQGLPTARLADSGAAALDRIFLVLRTVKGNDFALYKRSTTMRRIERRMGIHQIDTLDQYAQFLRDNPHEVDLLFKELLIGVTSFFRDEAAWEVLKEKVIIPLVRRRRGSVIRAWVVGCSTGEEAYSLGILMKEGIDKVQGLQNVRVQIFGTDLDRSAIETARAGIYPENIVADVSPDRLRRFFTQEDRGYRVSKEIRETVVFAPQNVIADPPFTKVDVITCRNLLIYFAPDLQKKLIPLFHYALNPQGALFLGSAETAGGFSGIFSPEDVKARIFRRIEPLDAPVVDFPPAKLPRPTQGERDTNQFLHTSKAASPNIQTLIERLLLEHYAPAAVLAGPKGDIVYISGKTGLYLEPPSGKTNWNVLAMAREGMRYELAGALSSAVRGTKPIVMNGLQVRSNGTTTPTDIVVHKLDDPEALRGKILVVFKPAAAPPVYVAKKGHAKRGVRAVEQELERTRSESQALREQMQTSDEELKSTNEELQSTNEELTTSKEELQSLNEELQTVNQELQSKVDELSRANNDMSNLLNSTDVATLFLDGNLNVRRFTTQTAKIIKLIPGDAGRPVTDIAMNIQYPELVEDSQEVLRTLVYRDKLVMTHETGDEQRWYAVRIMPYRTIDNVIDGVVITFSDATAQKKLEATLRDQASQLRQLADAVPNLIWGAKPSGQCDFLSAQWVAYTGVPESEQLGYLWMDHIHESDREELRKRWATSVKSGKMLDADARIRRADGVFQWFKIRAVPIRDERGNVTRWYGSCTDIEDLKEKSS